MWAQIFNMFLGLLVMVAPGIWDFPKDAGNNNYIVGPLIITFAMVAITDVGRNLRWVNIVCGIWLMLSPYVLGYGGEPFFINTVTSIGIIILSLIKGTVKNSFGGGWRSLLQDNPEHMKY